MAKRKPSSGGNSGTWKIDAATGELVQLSDGIAKVASKRRKGSLPAGTKCVKPNCGKGPCGGY